VARLELARGRAYHAADAAPVPTEALQTPDLETLLLVLHPSVVLFASPHPAVRIWQAHQDGARPSGPMDPGPDHALVARDPGFAVLVAQIDAGTHAVLAALAEGQQLGQAATLADPTAALTLLVRHGLIAATHRGETP
jgi:hypothetical protein